MIAILQQTLPTVGDTIWVTRTVDLPPGTIPGSCVSTVHCHSERVTSTGRMR